MKIIVVTLLIFTLIILLISNSEKFKNLKNELNLNIILPLRDREDDLKMYLEKMIPILDYQNINYKILIIEQKQGKKFNKGKINNVGFLEGRKRNQNNKYLFNDVDNFPLDKNIFNYKEKISGFKHLFGLNFCLGGFFLVNKKSFEKVNGYSNEYWGWGGEDDDLQYRCSILGVPIIRNNFVSRRDNKNRVFDDSKKSNHVKNDYEFTKLKKKKKEMYKKDSNTIMKDGINNTTYKILKEKKNYNNNPNITRLVVDI